jgi:hypothetical protein
MSKAKQPASVNDIEFDALISESYTLETTVPEYTVEDGFVVSDAIILNPEKLNMVLFVTDTPVTWKSHAGSGHTEQVCKQLEELYFNGEPVTVTTTDSTYTDMAIESLEISKSTEVGYAKEVSISFKKIRTTSVKTTTIPSSYGKSGATASSAGTASTSTSTSSSSSSTSSSSSSSSSSGSSSKSSILYSAASSLGLLS